MYATSHIICPAYHQSGCEKATGDLAGDAGGLAPRKPVAAEQPVLEAHEVVDVGYIVISALGVLIARFRTQAALAEEIGGRRKTRKSSRRSTELQEHGHITKRIPGPRDRRARLLEAHRVGPVPSNAPVSSASQRGGGALDRKHPPTTEASSCRAAGNSADGAP